jgi:hypothetical protein
MQGDNAGMLTRQAKGRLTRQAGQQGKLDSKAVGLPASFCSHFYCLLFQVDFLPTNIP